MASREVPPSVVRASAIASKSSASTISATGKTLSEISSVVEDSIAEIGRQIAKFQG